MQCHPCHPVRYCISVHMRKGTGNQTNPLYIYLTPAVRQLVYIQEPSCPLFGLALFHTPPDVALLAVAHLKETAPIQHWTYSAHAMNCFASPAPRNKNHFEATVLIFSEDAPIRSQSNVPAVPYSHRKLAKYSRRSHPCESQ